MRIARPIGEARLSGPLGAGAASSGRLEPVDRGAGGGLVRVPGGVDGRVVRPFGRQRLLGEDRVDRALRLAGAAVDALVRIDDTACDRCPLRSGCSRPGRPRRTTRRARRCTARRSHRPFRILLEAHRSSGKRQGRDREGTTGRAHEAAGRSRRRGRSRGGGRRTHRIGTCMPRAQWPGMWQPTTHPPASAGAGCRDRPDDVDPLAGGDDDPQARHVRRDADDRRRPGRSPGRGRLGELPGVLDRGVADDRLVDLEAAVDDVEQDRLAGDQVERVGQERVVLGDDVDLARRRRARRARSAAWRRERRPSIAAGRRARPGRWQTRRIARGEGDHARKSMTHRTERRRVFA